MPRRARIVLPGVPLHVIQRGNNRQACFFADDDYRLYLDQLRLCAQRAGCAIHAYVLMTNHVHLLLTPHQADSASVMMKLLGQRYVQHVNRLYRRSGTLWEGRFRSCIVQDEAYLLGCSRYIELNPVRAGMVAAPSMYRWSSHRANALGETDGLTEPHPVYTALGNQAQNRQTAYRALFLETLDTGFVSDVRRATNGNFALGSARFQKEVSATLGRRAMPGESGRPRKPGEAGSGEPL
ncbi:MAG TPA: transposase [Candidatus Desulfobacillus sp.]|nr:transposase [Candidatus Desulfobacillus sp.]